MYIHVHHTKECQCVMLRNVNLGEFHLHSTLRKVVHVHAHVTDLLFKHLGKSQVLIPRKARWESMVWTFVSAKYGEFKSKLACNPKTNKQ